MMRFCRAAMSIACVLSVAACDASTMDTVAGSAVASSYASGATDANVSHAAGANTQAQGADANATRSPALNANSQAANANSQAANANNAPAMPGPVVQLSAAWGGGYPRLIRLTDNSLLGTITSISQGVNHLRVTRSTDNGATFSDFGEITEGTGDIDNAQTIQLNTTAPGGTAPRILAAFRNHSRDASGNYTTYRITVCRSDDGGQTWVFHSQVATTQPPNGMWEPFLFQAPDSSVQVYYARENAADDQDIVMQRSTDGGVTWSAYQIVAGAGIISRDGMPGIVPYFDGTNVALVAIFESESNGTFQVMRVKSTDNGQTWSQRDTVFAPPAGHNAGSPQIAAVGSHLVTVFMTDEDATSIAWPANAAIKVVTSTAIDANTISWSAASTVAQASSYWPGILSNGSQSAFITYNGVAQLMPLSSLLP